jgi:hypothetical protein
MMIRIFLASACLLFRHMVKDASVTVTNARAPQFPLFRNPKTICGQQDHPHTLRDNRASPALTPLCYQTYGQNACSRPHAQEQALTLTRNLAVGEALKLLGGREGFQTIPERWSSCLLDCRNWLTILLYLCRGRTGVCLIVNHGLPNGLVGGEASPSEEKSNAKLSAYCV